MGTFGFDNASEDRARRVSAFPRDDKLEEGVGLWEHVVGAEEVGHGAVGVESVAEGGLGREPVEEREERLGG